MGATVIDLASQALAGSLTDAQVSATASIANTKLAPWTVDQDAGGRRLVNLAAGLNGGDAVILSQLDSVASGVSWKESVRLATDASLPAVTYSSAQKTLTASANGALTVDGVAVANNDRLLIKNQATGAENGIYIQTTMGDAFTPFVLTRAGDFDTDADIASGAAVYVTEGTTNGDSGWVLTTNEPITLDTTALTFTQFTGLGQVTAGAALTKTGNTLDVQVDANGGIEILADALTLKLDGTSLSKSVNGIKVAAGGIGTTELADGAVTAAKIPTSVAGNGIAGGSGTALSLDIFRESFTGDGTTTNFILANTPMTSGEMVYSGGLLQKKGATNDYTLTGATISFNTAPANGSNIEVVYFK